MYVYTIYTVTVNEKRVHEFQGEKGGGYGTVWWEEKEEENVIL